VLIFQESCRPCVFRDSRAILSLLRGSVLALARTSPRAFFGVALRP
jgi:hypothetical protein